MIIFNSYQSAGRKLVNFISYKLLIFNGLINFLLIGNFSNLVQSQIVSFVPSFGSNFCVRFIGAKAF